MKSKRYDWGVIVFIVGYHLALLIGLPIYFINHSPSWGLCVTAGVLMYISGMSVTAGYHRLYSHQTYKINPVVEAVLLFFATVATQGSALKWAADHRKHHAFVDTDRDPYSIKKGFMYAHVLWLFHKADPIDPKIIADLSKNRLLAFQHKYYGLLMMLCNALVFLFFGYLFNDYLSAFVFIWGVRMLVLHHFTWFINSLAHTWGSQKFSQEHSAVDNYLMSIFTFGEGYHNYHHTFASDYRNGVRWFHFDPTKWLIWTLSKFKLAHNLRRISGIRIQEAIISEQKSDLIEQVKQYLSTNRAIAEEKIEKLTADLLAKFASFTQLKEQYKEYKKERTKDKDSLKQLNREIKTLKKTLQADWQDWKRFCRDISTYCMNLEQN
ncbi:MAG: fatty acid desaturase [Chlamydiales bacterium]|nr:fatty acid desaturase [Chlamydiales bacterium]